MRRFVFNFIIFVLLQGALFALLRDPGLSLQKKCIARTIEKNERLKETRPPRTILVGGSNVSFGFDSELLESELGKPVVNMGLAAALGIEFMLNEVAPNIGRGDTVLLSFEYDLFSGGRDLLVTRQLLEMRPASIRYVAQRDVRTILTDFGFHWIGGVMRRHFLSPKHQPAYSLDAWDYAREDFDEANGYVGHHGKTNTFAMHPMESPLRVRAQIVSIPKHVAEEIADFAELCRARGADCYYTCPPQPKELLTTNIEPIRRNIQALKKIPHLTVLDSPEEHVYPDTLLFDVQYHLTAEGATLRTMKVTERLRAVR